MNRQLVVGRLSSALVAQPVLIPLERRQDIAVGRAVGHRGDGKSSLVEGTAIPTARTGRHIVVMVLGGSLGRIALLGAREIVVIDMRMGGK